MSVISAWIYHKNVTWSSSKPQQCFSVSASCSRRSGCCWVLSRGWFHSTAATTGWFSLSLSTISWFLSIGLILAEAEQPDCEDARKLPRKNSHIIFQRGGLRCSPVEQSRQPHKKQRARVTQIFARRLVWSFLEWKAFLTLAANCSAIPSEPMLLLINCLSNACWCAACIFNHYSNPLTFPQLNFQAPKPTLTLKPTRTQTGLSINLPRSWMPRALKSSALLEQVSPSCDAQLFPFSNHRLSYIMLTAKYLHLE